MVSNKSSGIKTIGSGHGIETVAVDGKTFAFPTQTVPAGYKGKLPGAVIGDKTITFPVVTATAGSKRDGININLPNYTIHEPANGKGGIAIISGTTYYPKATAAPKERDGVDINLPNYTIKDGSAVIKGTTYYPRATPAPKERDGVDINLPNYTVKDASAVISGTTYYPRATAGSKRDGININLPNYTVHEPANGKGGFAIIDGTTFHPRATAAPKERDGIDINLPNYTIKDGSAVIKGTTYYPRATAEAKRDGIDINLPNYTVKEPANGKGGYAVIKGTTYSQPAARATAAPARRQAAPTTTWANGIETVIYDGQTIALPNVTISGTETPTSLPAATIGDQTFTFPVVTADPNAPAPTLSLSSVSGIPLPPSVTAFTPIGAAATGSPAAAVPVTDGTLSLSSVSGIPLPPTTATIPGLSARGFVDDMSTNNVDAEAWKHLAQNPPEHAGMFACGALVGIMVTSMIAVLAVFVAMRNKNKNRLRDSAEYQQFLSAREEAKWKDQA